MGHGGGLAANDVSLVSSEAVSDAADLRSNAAVVDSASCWKSWMCRGDWAAKRKRGAEKVRETGRKSCLRIAAACCRSLELGLGAGSWVSVQKQRRYILIE